MIPATGGKIGSFGIRFGSPAYYYPEVLGLVARRIIYLRRIDS